MIILNTKYDHLVKLLLQTLCKLYALLMLCRYELLSILKLYFLRN